MNDEKPHPIIACSLFAAIFAFGAQTSLQCASQPTESVGPRTLEKQTEAAVIRDYLQAWSSLTAAFEQNRADLLDPDFVGTAREKLADTIRRASEAWHSDALSR